MDGVSFHMGMHLRYMDGEGGRDSGGRRGKDDRKEEIPYL